MGNYKVIFYYLNGCDVIINVLIEYCKCLFEGVFGMWGIVYDEEGNVVKYKIECE